MPFMDADRHGGGPGRTLVQCATGVELYLDTATLRDIATGSGIPDAGAKPKIGEGSHVSV
jgi:hypothetical protein